MADYVTEDTITDEQIRVVLEAFQRRTKRRNAYIRAVIMDCRGALDGSHACRETAANAWNRMQAATAPPSFTWNDPPFAREKWRGHSKSGGVETRTVVDRCLGGDVCYVVAREPHRRQCTIAEWLAWQAKAKPAT